MQQTIKKAAALNVSHVVDRILTKFDQGMMAISATSLFAIMIMIFMDAMARYLFNNPLSFVFDLVVLYLMSASLLSIMSYTLRHGGHISIDIFANMMPRRVYLILIGLALLAGMAVCAMISWQIAHLSWDSFERKEVMTGVYPWPLWIGKAIVALSFIGMTARLAHIGIANLVSGLFDIPDLEIKILHEPTDPEGEI